MTNYTLIDNSLITDSDLPDGAYRLYNLLLSMCYGDKDTCYPSIAYLAEKLHKSTKTIGRNLKILKDKGLILSRRRGSISNIYTLVKKSASVKGEKIVNTIKDRFINKKNNNKYPKKEDNWNTTGSERSYDFGKLESALLGYDEITDRESLYKE